MRTFVFVSLLCGMASVAHAGLNVSPDAKLDPDWACINRSPKEPELGGPDLNCEGRLTSPVPSTFEKAFLGLWEKICIANRVDLDMVRATATASGFHPLFDGLDLYLDEHSPDRKRYLLELHLSLDARLSWTGWEMTVGRNKEWPFILLIGNGEADTNLIKNCSLIVGDVKYDDVMDDVYSNLHIQQQYAHIDGDGIRIRRSWTIKLFGQPQPISISLSYVLSSSHGPAILTASVKEPISNSR